MKRHSQEIRAKLRAAGLIDETVRAPETLDSPWYVKLLLAFSGWLAALFILGFLGIGFEFVFENPFIALIVGTAMISAAFAILRSGNNEFVEHLGLAASLAGQVLVVFAIFEFADGNEKMGWLLLALLEIVLAAVIPNFVHRVFSAFAAALALDMTVSLRGAPYVASGLVMLLAAQCWLDEFRSSHGMRIRQAVGYGLVLALVHLEGMALFGVRTTEMMFGRPPNAPWTQPWMGELLIGMVSLYVVLQLLRRSGGKICDRASGTALLAGLLVCAASMQVQGLTVGMVIILLGYAGANRVLTGLGIASLLGYLSSYYYLLDATLLAKSGSLLTVGLTLLCLRWLMNFFVPLAKEAGDA